MMLSQLATERAEREAERETQERRMADLIQFVSRMGAQTGLQMPPTLFAPPQPPVVATPVSMNFY